MYPLLHGLLNAPDTDPSLKEEIKELLVKCSTIRNLTDAFVKITRQKNIPLYYDNEYGVDGDIFAWLPNAIVSAVPFPKGNWTSVGATKGTTEKEMLKTAQKMCLSQAVQCFTAELEAGTFDAKETYRIILLEETGVQENSLKLICHRHSDGKLHLFVYRLASGVRWRGAGGAWLATNA